MSTGTMVAQPHVIPFEVYSVHFNFPGGQAIRLRDHATNEFLGLTPEWVTSGSNDPIAYVRGASPQIRVVFQRVTASDGSYTVGAGGSHSAVEEQQVDLAF